MENKKLVIFDFDGVLVNTLEVCLNISQETNANLSREEYKSFFSANIFQAKRLDGSPRKNHPNFFSMYDQQCRELKIPDAIKESVKNLSKKFTLVIASSTDTASIRKILDREQILEFFGEILGADVHTDKAHKIKMLLEKYHCKPEDAIFITDTSGDVHEGKVCNVSSICVTWGFHDKEELEKANPTHIVDDPGLLEVSIENVLK